MANKLSNVSYTVVSGNLNSISDVKDAVVVGKLNIIESDDRYDYIDASIASTITIIGNRNKSKQKEGEYSTDPTFTTVLGNLNDTVGGWQTAIGRGNIIGYPGEGITPELKEKLEEVGFYHIVSNSDGSGGKFLRNTSGNLAVGTENFVDGFYSVGLGIGTNSQGVSAIAIGAGRSNGADRFGEWADIPEDFRQKNEKFADGNLSIPRAGHSYSGLGTHTIGNFSVAMQGAHITKDGDFSIAMGQGSVSDKSNAVVLGSFSYSNADKGVQGYLADGKTDATWQSTLAAVGIGDAEYGVTRQITSVAAGTADTDAVNVAQLKVVKDLVDTKADKSDLDALKTAIDGIKPVDISGKADKADVNAKNATQDAAIAANTDAIKALDDKKADKSDLDALKDNITAGFKPELDKKADKADLDALNDAAVKYDGADKSTVTLAGNGGTTITNVKDGALTATSKDAVNGSQLHATNEVLKTKADKAYVDAQDALINNRIDGLDTAINHQAMAIDRLDSRIDHLDDEMRVGLAKQAALAGLFQPYTIGKGNASFAVGGYGTEVAVALGAGYRFDEKWAVKAGFSTGLNSGDGYRASYNVGVNYEW